MSDDVISSRHPPAARRLRLLRLAVVGGLLGFVAAVGIVIVMRRSSLPDLTQPSFAAAMKVWREQQPRDYKIAIDVRGAQPALYEVEVQGGAPISASRNGTPIKQPRSWETWSVPGMFDTLQSDLDSLGERGHQLVVRCRFDPEFGYPAQYERVELGTGLQVSWTVTKFERSLE